MTSPKPGTFVNFGAHGDSNGAVLPMPALVCRVLGEGEHPNLDLYIYNSFIGQCGFAYNVMGGPKLRVGGWSLSEEYEVIEPAKVETRSPPERTDALPTQAKETPKELDPQTDGVANIFGGITRYNPAVNRQQHSNDRGQLLWICPDLKCGKSHWFDKGSKIPEDLGCCSDNIRRRAPGRQADPAWDLWKIPDDTVLVGKGEAAEADGRGPGE